MPPKNSDRSMGAPDREIFLPAERIEKSVRRL